jgi:SAM-dependent methyltransferase
MIKYCPVCGNNNLEMRGPYRAQHASFDGIKLVQCLSCEMVFAEPMPSQDKLEQYNASYFTSAHGGKPQGAATLAFFTGVAKLRRDFLEGYLLKLGVSVCRILEVGPGPGWFARSWLARRPQTIYCAIETDTSCHKSIIEMGVRLLSNENITNEEGLFDLVVMTHVLEHVTNPVDFLVESTKRLRSGGVLFIEVPCRDWEHKTLDEPHLLFFDKKSMQHLLERIGFEKIQLSYHGQSIEKLRRPSRLASVWNAIRGLLIARGVIAPFGRYEPGLESLNPLERAAVRPFQAHMESDNPSWWLRAIVCKI